MKRAIPFSLLVLSLLTLPGPALSKDRGCGNRLAVVAESERVLQEAFRSGHGIDEARAAFVRAREKAFEEGCLVGTRWDRNTRYDSDPRYRDSNSRGFDSRRFDDRSYAREDYLRQRRDELVQLGYRRGLSRDEFRELEELRNRVGR
jgi:hypothetical protein